MRSGEIYRQSVSAVATGTRSRGGGILWAGAVTCVQLLSGCTTQMHVHSHHPDATVYINGAPRGDGEEVTVSELVGTSRTYYVETRVTPECRQSMTLDAEQNPARVIGCMAGSIAGGAAGGVLGAGIAGASDTSYYTTGILSGIGTGALIGLLCLITGYEAPALVDLDVSHCKVKGEP